MQGGYSIHLCCFICLVRLLAGLIHLTFRCLTFLDPPLLVKLKCTVPRLVGMLTSYASSLPSTPSSTCALKVEASTSWGLRYPLRFEPYIRGFSRSHTLSNVRSLRLLRRIWTLHENGSSVTFLGNHVQCPLVSQEHARCTFLTGLRVA